MTVVHIMHAQGPFYGVVWFRGMKRGQVGPGKPTVEEARRWCVRRFLREATLNRAVVKSSDYDDHHIVWRGTQR